MRAIDFIQTKQVPIYRLAKEMGKNPDSHAYSLKKKIEGKVAMSQEEYVDMIRALAVITGSDMNTNMFEQTVDKIRLL